MRILFFDTESANGHSGVCEFGYLFCDNDFSIIEKNNIIMNPKHVQFSEFILDILSRKEEEYRKGIDSKEVLPKIREILDSADLIIGHTLVSDFKFLNADCEYYGFDKMIYNHLDIAKFYSRIKGVSHPVKLSKMGDELLIKRDGTIHDALSDSILTYECYKELSKMKGYDSVTGLKEEYKNLESKMNTKISKAKITKPVDDPTYRKGKINSIIKNFEKVKEFERIDGITGNKFFVQTTYTTGNFEKTIDLILRILKCGGKIVDSRKSCDIYLYNKNISFNKFEREEYVDIVINGKKKAMLISDLMNLFK